MGTPQFADLTAIPTQTDTLNQEVLPQLQAQPGGLQITSWVLGGVYRSLAMLVAYLRVQARTFIAAFTAAGYEDYVFGRSVAPSGMDVTGWAAITAQQRYGLQQKPATYTLRNITLTNGSATPYNNLVSGPTIIIQFPSGNRYILNQTVSIPGNASVSAQFRSELPMALGLTYNSDLPGSTLQLVTSNFPGVTATNPGTTFSPVSLSGTGIGAVVPSGTPMASYQVVLKITATGNAGDSTVGWSTSLNGGTFEIQTGNSVTNLDGSGIDIALTDSGGNPAFIIGTSYYFSCPGSDITQPGAAIESAQALGLRCKGLWALLPSMFDANGNYVPPASPTQAAYIALALSANLNVVNAFVQPDLIINNLLHLYVAGQGGAALPSNVLAAEQTFFSSLNMVCDQVVVQTPTGRTVTLGLSNGAIQVASAQLASAKQAMQQSLSAYLGGTDSSQPLGMNGLLDYDYLVSLIRTTPGVKRVPAGALVVTVNGVPYTTDVQLPITPGAVEVAQWTQTAATAFPFQGV